MEGVVGETNKKRIKKANNKQRINKTYIVPKSWPLSLIALKSIAFTVSSLIGISYFFPVLLSTTVRVFLFNNYYYHSLILSSNLMEHREKE